MSVGFDTSVKNYDSNFCLESFVKKIQYNVFAFEAEKKRVYAIIEFHLVNGLARRPLLEDHHHQKPVLCIVLFVPWTRLVCSLDFWSVIYSSIIIHVRHVVPIL